jgi:oxygen-dependent protoporphyrinogen oxidase
MKEVAIIGAGITGLTTAWELQQKGISVRVFEKRSQPGGSIRTFEQEGYLVEEGPNSLQLSSLEHEEFLKKLGLGNELIDTSPKAKNRFLVRYGAPLAAPLSPLQFLKTPLFSKKAKFRLLLEPFIFRPNYKKEETLANFVRRRLGHEMLDYAINPFVGGIYAGDPEKLSLKYAFPKLYRLEKNYRSLILGSLKLRRQKKRDGILYKTRSVSFKSGLQALPIAIARDLGEQLTLNANIHKITKAEKWKISWSDNEGNNHDDLFDAVISAVPATSLPHIDLGLASQHPLTALSEIYHPPVASIAMGFRKEDIPHDLDGFGMLLPAKEPFQILGTLFSSSLFPNRAPDDHILLTTFTGGTRAPENAQLTQDELRELVMKDLSVLLNIKADPVFQHTTLWQKAIPQYQIGHGKHIERMKAFEEKNPGFFIGGNSRDGISLSYCLDAGNRLSQEALQFLKN